MVKVKESFMSDRLILKLVSTDDASFVRKLVNSDGWLQFIGQRDIHSTEDAVNYIEKLLKAENFFYWVVRSKVDEVPVGIISLLKREYLQHFDLGFAFLPEFNGKGYAFEAAYTVLEFLKKEGHMKTLLATTIPENNRSIKLLNKLHFKFTEEKTVGDEKLLIYTHADQ